MPHRTSTTAGVADASAAAADSPASTGELILATATELFARRGYHATSMRDIAGAMRMQAAGIYHWYENKEAILVQIQDSFLTELTSAVADAVAAHQGAEVRLAAAVREHVLFHGGNALTAFVTDSEIRSLTGPRRAAIIAKRDAYQELFIDLIEAGAAAGVFVVSDARIAGFTVLLACTGVATWFDPRGPRNLREVAEIHVELVLGALGTGRTVITKAIAATREPVTVG